MKTFRFFAILLLFPLFVSCSSQLRMTEETATEQEEMQKTNNEEVTVTETKQEGKDPSQDNELNFLFIGNSYSYYWTDELWGLLNGAGYQNVTVCNVYYSGCTFKQHVDWAIERKANYDFVTNDAKGRSVQKQKDLKFCLDAKEWDCISFQQSGRYIYSGGEDAHRKSIEEDFPTLYAMVTKRFPKARYFWQQNWVHGLGKDVQTLEEQLAVGEAIRKVSYEVCQKYPLTNAPLGDAWELVRHDPLIKEGGKTLTTRIFLGKPNYDDLSHDGDVGGGQYLNACVWFETLTGKSCVGNPFRPKYVFKDVDYSLTEEKITLLQNAAHKTVASQEK